MQDDRYKAHTYLVCITNVNSQLIAFKITFSAFQHFPLLSNTCIMACVFTSLLSVTSL